MCLRETPRTDREIRKTPRRLLGEVDRQRLFLLRVEGTPVPCTACQRPTNAIEAAGNSLLLEVEQILAATDVRQLAQAASAAGKLQEIHKKLNGLKGGDGRVARAKDYVSQQIKRIKLASIEAL